MSQLLNDMAATARESNDGDRSAPELPFSERSSEQCLPVVNRLNFTRLVRLMMFAGKFRYHLIQPAQRNVLGVSFGSRNQNHPSCPIFTENDRAVRTSRYDRLEHRKEALRASSVISGERHGAAMRMRME